MIEYRRILLDGNVVDVVRTGDDLVAGDGRTVGVEDAVHLAPALPSKIICVHLNYSSRVEEMMTTLPPAPTYFHKPVSALNAHQSAVVRPSGCKWLNYEGEIAIVIGRTAKHISPDDAGDYIRGYSIGNDYGLHDFRDTDSGSMLRVKGADTLCPIGPGLIEGWDFRHKQIRTLVNGEVLAGREHRRDAVEHALSGRRHRADDHAAALGRAAPPHSGYLPHRLSRRRGRGRSRGAGNVAQPHRARTGTPIRSDVGAQPTESEEVLSTAQGGDWGFCGSRQPDPSRTH